MKIVVSALLLLVCMSANVNAATCRSGEAAVRGSKSGYEEDKKAAEQIVEEELSFSDVLEKCVGGVTGIKAGPSYGPSEGFGDLADLIFNQVCKLARDKINDSINGSTESRMESALENLYSNYEKYQQVAQAGTTVNSGSPGTLPKNTQTFPKLNLAPPPAAAQPDPNTVNQPGGTSSPSESAFWNDIWK